MRINLEFDAQAMGAPQSFRDAIQSAADILDGFLINPITVNIAVGYGEITSGGVTSALTNGAAAGAPAAGDLYSYPTYRALALGLGSYAGVGPLDPGVTPGLLRPDIPGDTVKLWSAEEKALGLIAPAGAALDGAVGFAMDVPAGQLVGLALNELTQAMGRVTNNSTTLPDLLDLYRFTAGSAYAYPLGNPAASAYFSVDGGGTRLANYDVNAASNAFLNDSFTPNDPFNQVSSASTQQDLSGYDRLQMEALGFNLIAAGGHAANVKSDMDRHGVSALALIDPASGDWGYLTVLGHYSYWHDLGPAPAGYTPVGYDAFAVSTGAGGVLPGRAMAFRNNITGDWGYATSGQHLVSEGWTSPAYSVAGFGDFNGDGVADLALRNNVTGDWGYMAANPMVIPSVTPQPAVWHDLGWSSPDYVAIGAGDFNGDGALDMAFRNNTTGDFGFMTISGATATWHGLGWSSPGYAAVGVGDFNGDGVADIAFRNNATGDYGYMALSNAYTAAWHGLGWSDPAYTLVQTGDYNGDRIGDFIFRNNATGALAMVAGPSPLLGAGTWTTIAPGNYAILGAGDLNHDGAADLMLRDVYTGDWGFLGLRSGVVAWQPESWASVSYGALGVGDLDGDGNADVAFRDPTTGDWGFMGIPPATTPVSSWNPLGWSSPDYVAVGVADFNGDGVAEAAFRNNATGDFGFFSVGKTRVATWHDLGWSSPDYVAVGTADFNGDGAADIAFRSNATGDWGYMALGKTGTVTWNGLGWTSPAYTAIGTGDFNGDGRADVAFRNAGTGDWGYMTVNGAGQTAWHSLGWSSPDYAVVGAGDFNGDHIADMAFRSQSGDFGYLSVGPSGVTAWHDLASAFIGGASYFAI